MDEINLEELKIIEENRKKIFNKGMSLSFDEAELLKYIKENPEIKEDLLQFLKHKFYNNIS